MSGDLMTWQTVVYGIGEAMHRLDVEHKFHWRKLEPFESATYGHICQRCLYKLKRAGLQRTQLHEIECAPWGKIAGICLGCVWAAMTAWLESEKKHKSGPDQTAAPDKEHGSGAPSPAAVESPEASKP